MTVALDNPITGEHDALELWPVADVEPEGELILLSSEPGGALFRGMAYGALICLCFWIPLAIAVVLTIVLV